MPTNVSGMGTTFNLPNYSGELATASVTETPFLTMVLAKPMRVVAAVEFTTSSDYSLPDASANGISENDAADVHTNVTATNIVRAQSKNVIQTFVDKLSISYLKEATNGQMSGLNIAGQVNNAPSELDFQRSMILKKNARNMEYAFLNGEYNLAETANDENTTRGMFASVNEYGNDGDFGLNEYDMTGKGALTKAHFEGAIKKLYDNGAFLENMYVFVNSTQKQALTAIYGALNGFTLPTTRTESGINIVNIVTDFCEIKVVLDKFIPQDKILICDMNYIKAVQLLTNGSNFYFEPIAKAGAAYEEMFYGNIGLDYGPQFLHGAIVNIGATAEQTPEVPNPDQQ